MKCLLLPWMCVWMVWNGFQATTMQLGSKRNKLKRK
jgi:hypothetical protein